MEVPVTKEDTLEGVDTKEDILVDTLEEVLTKEDILEEDHIIEEQPILELTILNHIFTFILHQL